MALKNGTKEYKVQLNTWITVPTRERLDKFVNWKRSTKDLPPDAEDWPNSVTEVVEAALSQFLAEHRPHRKRGPEKKG